MTILPNPFMSSAEHMPVATAAAVAPATCPVSAAAEPLHPRGCPDPEWCIANNGCYWNCQYDIHGATEHIGEIFYHARKLIAEDSRRDEDFVDFAELEAALAEPLPLFIRDGEHLKRWA
jgi:hypothetical protein